MAILRDVHIQVTTKQLLAEGERGRHQPSLVAAAEKAVALSQSLLAPLVVHDEFKTLGIAGERVQLAPDGRSLSVGPKVDLLAPAESLQIAVYTIGAALEIAASDLLHSGEPLLAYMHDCAGVLALGEIGQRVRDLTEEQAAARGWGVSPALSPGSLVG